MKNPMHNQRKTNNGSGKDNLRTMPSPQPAPAPAPAATSAAAVKAPAAKPDKPHSQAAAKALAEAQELIIKDFPDIIKGLISAAIKGNHLPARLLMELAGIAPPPQDDPSSEREESLAELLLHELEQTKAV